MSSPALPASGSPRLHGLDALRAAAILLVFAYHYQVFVSGRPTFGWLSEIGWAGVDLFFVLSGYLIANQLMGGMRRGDQLSLPRFYGRRLLRTLPNFYVVLALYVLFPTLLGGREPPPLWRFLTFTQNIGLTPGTAFSHAWSLCIEEQFYLALPAALMLGATLKQHRRALAWSLIGVLTLAAIAWRDHLWRLYGTQDPSIGYYPQLYYGSLARLDEFLPGVAVALLKHGHPALWAALMQRSRALLAIGAAASLGMLTLMLHGYYIDGYGYGHAMSSWGYSALAWSFGLMVLAALAPASPMARVRIPGANALARWSYALYLTHKPIAYALTKPLLALGLTRASGVTALLIAAACLLGGWLLYRLVELPFLRLRDRWIPSQFEATARATTTAQRSPQHA
ncbi:acyltransferase [Mitsuaria sp. GD03876]|uniref:acyltransferase family protein n=1 Tax=Mitsuaria sp. GD03876 TaxID=2975399 RepID=UPI00244AEE0D|nr:acyltransferase [Mitsuaria sp. GD03876]MDH0866371.1 acyltransferase [Mitsuaria sp. GD03876]